MSQVQSLSLKESTLKSRFILSVLSGNEKMPHGDHWFTIHIAANGDMNTDRATLDACARTIQKTLAGVTCWRESFEWFATQCYDPSDRKAAIQKNSCVEKIWGPFDHPDVGYTRPYFQIK